MRTGNICWCNLTSNRTMYSERLTPYYRSDRKSTTSLALFSERRTPIKSYPLDCRPPWNSSTHAGNRYAPSTQPASKRPEYPPEVLKIKIKGLAHINQQTSRKESSSLAGKSTWAFYLLDLPEPIRSTRLGYTNARRVILRDGSEFYNRPFAGLPSNKYSDSVANCLAGTDACLINR